MFEKILSLFRSKEVPASADKEPHQATQQTQVNVAEESLLKATNLKEQADSILRSGDIAQAEQCYREAINSHPTFADAYINLSVALRMQKKFAEAAEALKQAQTLNPGDAYIYYNKGVLAKEQADYSSAISEFRKALAFDGNMLDAYYDLIETYVTTDDKVAAHSIASLAVEKFPQEMGLLLLMANLETDRKQHDAALQLYNRALAMQPDHADTIWHISWILQGQGKLVEAEASYRRLLEVAPDRYEAYYNLGTVFNTQSRKEEAISAYLKAVALKPDAGIAHYNLGKAYSDIGKLDEAEASFRAACALEFTTKTWALVSLGNLLRDTGRQNETIDYYKAATTIDPDYFDAYSSMLFNLCFGDLVTPENYQSEVNRYAARLLTHARAYNKWKCLPVSQEQRRLRVGFVSGDFGLHPVGFFLENVISNINLRQIELYAYSSKVRDDALTSRIKPFFSGWKVIENIDDASAARMIHEDGIDILIDLAGHTAHNRLPVFAFKPAPLQVSWLGYFATTGVPGMDYLLADRISVPETHNEYFTEQIWYLPSTRLCLTPPAYSELLASVPPLPALKNGYITFGCFQNIRKLNDFTLQLWAKIFDRMPNAKLRFQCWQLATEPERKKMLDRFVQHGIAAERVSILGPGSREAYLAAHAEVDIILDTSPYGGGTTTCEAFWMGVPTISLAGNTMSSLQGASLLTYAGLEDWIANSEDDYVWRALSHAADLEKLAQLRATLRQRSLNSSLYDAKQFTQHFEQALLGMWDKHVQATRTECTDVPDAKP